LTTYALLVTALLFGGMTLYSFTFAAFLFMALPAETASLLLRKAFPHFYMFVLVAATIAAISAFAGDPISSAVLLVISATSVFARQVLMPMINAATDAGQKRRFQMLHSASVVLTLAQIGAAAFVVVRLANV
jgi:hypothetical protein